MSSPEPVVLPIMCTWPECVRETRLKSYPKDPELNPPLCDTCYTREYKRLRRAKAEQFSDLTLNPRRRDVQDQIEEAKRKCAKAEQQLLSAHVVVDAARAWAKGPLLGANVKRMLSAIDAYDRQVDKFQSRNLEGALYPP